MPGDDNVRVKDKNGNWRFARAKRADEAYAVAAQLLTEEEK